MDWILLDFGRFPGIYKVQCAGGKCKALLWDFSTLCVEELSEEDALKRANDMNKSSELNTESLLKIITSTPKESCLQENPAGGILKLKFYVDRIPFRYEWRVLKVAKELEEVTQSITIPLMISLKQSLDREKELIKLLQGKEDELNDYRGQKVPLMNKFLETSEFVLANHKRSVNFDFLGESENNELLSKVLPDLDTKPDLLANQQIVEDCSIAAPNLQPKKRKKDNKLLIRAVELRYSQADSQDSSQELLPLPPEVPLEKKENSTQPAAAKKKRRQISDLL